MFFLPQWFGPVIEPFLFLSAFFPSSLLLHIVFSRRDYAKAPLRVPPLFLSSDLLHLQWDVFDRPPPLILRLE